jgi:signal transduction histidine kinase
VIEDDGRGFDPGLHADGMGLVGMRERAALLDGGLEVESAPGAGATIRVAIPLGDGR